MEIREGARARVDAAYGAIIADGFFALAFTVHLLNSQTELILADYLGVGLILCVFLSACWVIYDGYWAAMEQAQVEVVKKLRIKELKQGAQIEFDGTCYRVGTIDRADGKILIERVGKPGSIVVQVEGK